MAFDAHKNLAVSTVATAPTPATSGTSLVVAGGEGVRFPAPPFNATLWPASATPTPANAEVVRVTARATDTLTLVRAQEGSTARAVGVGDLIAQTITAKTLTDLETQAALKDAANVFTLPQTLRAASPQLYLQDTVQPADATLFDVVNSSQGLRVRAVTDAGAVQTNALVLARTGDAIVGRDVYEKGRALPMGHWQTGDCSTFAHTAGWSGPCLWMVLGKTIFMVMAGSANMAAGAASYNFNLPVGGVYAAATVNIPISVSTPAHGMRFGTARFTAAQYYFQVFDVDAVPWPAGIIQFNLSLAIPYQ